MAIRETATGRISIPMNYDLRRLMNTCIGEFFRSHAHANLNTSSLHEAMCYATLFELMRRTHAFKLFINRGDLRITLSRTEAIAMVWLLAHETDVSLSDLKAGLYQFLI